MAAGQPTFLIVNRHLATSGSGDWSRTIRYRAKSGAPPAVNYLIVVLNILAAQRFMGRPR